MSEAATEPRHFHFESRGPECECNLSGVSPEHRTNAELVQQERQDLSADSQCTPRAAEAGYTFEVPGPVHWNMKTGAP